MSLKDAMADQPICGNCKWCAKLYEGNLICLYYTSCQMNQDGSQGFVWQVSEHNDATQCEAFRKKPREVSAKELGLSRQEIDRMRRRNCR